MRAADWKVCKRTFVACSRNCTLFERVNQSNQSQDFQDIQDRLSRLENFNPHLELHTRGDSNYFATDTDSKRSKADCAHSMLSCLVPVGGWSPNRGEENSSLASLELFEKRLACSKVANVYGKNWTFLRCFDFFHLPVSSCFSSRTEQKPEFSREDPRWHIGLSDAQTYNHGESA